MQSNLKQGWKPAPAVFAVLILAMAAAAQSGGEALTGFDNQTNGAISQDDFDSALAVFSEVEGPSDGLGPVFNADSCVACHFTAGAVGGSSQVLELRAGNLQTTWHGRRNVRFTREFRPASVVLPTGDVIANRSLINQRATCAEAQSTVPPGSDVVATRLSLSVFGDGYIEAVPDDTLKNIADNQALQTQGRIRGQWVPVPVLEAGTDVTAVGRFGWKSQHASLLSFAADAYLNEMGITTPLAPDEATTVCQYPGMAEPNDEDTGDLELFAAFMRATKAPPRNAALAATPAALAGGQIFEQIGCATCHVPTMTTAPAGTIILGGQYVIPAALGDKMFHPFSDFLLHDVGTGDGILQHEDYPETAGKMRTMPLWGLRTRPQLMHDGLSPTYDHAILRHRGEALDVIRRYYNLTRQQKQSLHMFLRSL
jgi:CxxC motif-containing protein (DUF1111 family)